MINSDSVQMAGYRDIARSFDSKSSGYDIMILSDLLHFSDSHDALISSIMALLSRDTDAKVFIGVRRLR